MSSTNVGKDWQNPPFINTSVAQVESLVTYLRYTHAISYERLSGILSQVFGLTISEGALANLLMRVKLRLDDRVAEILERLRRSRLICSDETGARVKGQNQWEWVFQNDQVCLHVIRSRRNSVSAASSHK